MRMQNSLPSNNNSATGHVNWMREWENSNVYFGQSQRSIGTGTVRGVEKARKLEQ